ncbi:MAG: hypothetical protein IPP67_04675 [Rhodospirillaceae bacterium]|nr:hypothetical protein [Rhodospirillaceae bacterium]
MKCYNHPATDSVGTCNGCNKGLCKECASLWSTFNIRGHQYSGGSFGIDLRHQKMANCQNK